MSTALVGVPVVVALIGQLAVAVAAVVVVLAIIAVVVMVLRNNGAARQAAGGLGYDTHHGGRGDYDDSYDNAPAQWARQGGPQQGGAWQNGGNGGNGNGYGGQNGGNGYDRQGGPPAQGGRTSGANWGQGDPQAAPAWGGPPAGGDAGRQWGNQQPAPAMNSMPRAQGQMQQNPWDAPDAGMPWNDNQAGPGNQGNQGWGQPAAQAAPAWGAPAAAPDQNAWGVAAPNSGGQQNAWGPPPTPQPAAPQQNAWGASPTPSGPNWGSPPPMPNTPPTQPWAGPGGQGGYDAPPAAPYGGMNGQERGRPGVNLRPGAIMVKEGKEPGRVFEIRGDRLTIGRSRDSDIFLEDLAVSRLHATVYREPNGLYVVRDENSANGTTVNGQRITEQPLDEGDEIGLGQTILTFVRR